MRRCESGCWRDGRVSLAGKHYQVDGAIVAPKPLQDGGPPMWIAGGGEKVTLRIAAKYAQHWNFPGGDTDTFRRKVDVLYQHCADVGRDPAEIRLQVARFARENERRLAR